jgi:hypothetical protein
MDPPSFLILFPFHRSELALPVLPDQFSIHRKSKSDASKALISSLFPSRYNLLKNKEIAMSKRSITPLFHFLAAD